MLRRLVRASCVRSHLEVSRSVLPCRVPTFNTTPKRYRSTIRFLPVSNRSIVTMSTSPLRPNATLTPDQRQTKTIHTAACLCIADEVLNGKTLEKNSHYLAKWCFTRGIDLKRVEIIEDDETEIGEAVRRMSDRYDFVITSGGIGPTHDDITYPSIAKAFGLPLVLHQEAFERMRKMTKDPGFNWDQDSAQLRARKRMVELPTDTSRDIEKQAVFPTEQEWVPVAIVNGNVHILPGIPRLFSLLLEGLSPLVQSRLAHQDGNGIFRAMVFTPLAESRVAEYLTKLAAEVGPKGVKVGSYPQGDADDNIVTLVGRDQEFIESIVEDVATNVEGKRVRVEEGQETPQPAR